MNRTESNPRPRSSLNPKFLLEEEKVRHVGFFEEETFAAMLDGSPKVFFFHKKVRQPGLEPDCSTAF